MPNSRFSALKLCSVSWNLISEAIWYRASLLMSLSIDQQKNN